MTYTALTLYLAHHHHHLPHQGAQTDLRVSRKTMKRSLLHFDRHDRAVLGFDHVPRLHETYAVCTLQGSLSCLSFSNPELTQDHVPKVHMFDFFNRQKKYRKRRLFVAPLLNRLAKNIFNKHAKII